MLLASYNEFNWLDSLYHLLGCRPPTANPGPNNESLTRRSWLLSWYRSYVHHYYCSGLYHIEEHRHLLRLILQLHSTMFGFTRRPSKRAARWRETTAQPLPALFIWSSHTEPSIRLHGFNGLIPLGIAQVGNHCRVVSRFLRAAVSWVLNVDPRCSPTAWMSMSLITNKGTMWMIIIHSFSSPDQTFTGVDLFQFQGKDTVGGSLEKHNNWTFELVPRMCLFILN